MKTHLEYISKQELMGLLLSEGRDDYMVIDEKVKSYLPKDIVNSKRVFWLTHPESQKNSDVYLEIIDYFLIAGLARDNRIIAIGGGATTDIAGFVAATILRGVEWFSVPTTLLGMVDSAIGGKVGINSKHGKNQIGAFHLPSKVFICKDFIQTLSEEEIISGKGEILKYCFLNKSIYQSVMNQDPLEIIIRKCAEYKKSIVEEDFKENNKRIILNLGHTLGHCYERAMNISHGRAVMYGILAILQMFELHNRIEDFNHLVRKLDIQLGKLPKVSSTELEKYLSFDKKRRANDLSLVVVQEIGEAQVIKKDLNEVILLLRRVL